MKKSEQGFIEYVVGIVIGLIVLMVVGTVIFLSVYPSTHHTQRTFTVNKTENVATNGSNGHEYLIYTDQGTFKDVDSVLNRKYNSSDLYGQIEAGKKYSCDTTGFRFQFTSDYPNLISCTEVK